MAIIRWARAATHNAANTYLGANGELVIDMEQNRLFLYDGANAYVSNTFFSANVFIASAGADWTGSVTETIIRDSNAEGNDNFGTAVSTKGDYIIVGAQGDNYYGGAYVYTLSGGSWSQGTKLEQSDTGTGDQFGNDVDISLDGTYAAVGNYADEEETSGFNFSNLNYGAVYIFYYSSGSWSQQAKLKPSDLTTGDNFGRSVRMSNDGDYIIGGSPRQESGGTSQGAAYIFTRSGASWSQQAKLEASDGQDNDLFGTAVGLSVESADYAIVGAYLEDGSGSGDARRGKAYVYLRTGTSWAQQAILTASDAGDNDFFGTSVALSADGLYAAVGATGESSQGAVYIFLRTGTSWAQQAKIVSSDIQSGDSFGTSVDLNSDGTFLAVGANGEDGPDGTTSNSGAAYVFERDGTTWTEVKQLRASDYQANDQLANGSNGAHGIAINSDGTRVVAGAKNEDGGSGDPLANSGAVYIFDA